MQQQDSQLQQSDFKRQRQLYLAQRNAHKQQARMVIKKQFGNSSSHSSDSSKPQKKIPLIIKPNNDFEDCNTNSSKNSGEKDLKIHDIREKRKLERLKHKKEALMNKKKQFGTSSSDDEYIPKLPKVKIAQVSPTKNKQASQNLKSAHLANKVTSTELKTNLLTNVKLKSQNGDKRVKEIYDIEIPSKKGVNLWIEKEMQLKQTGFEFGNRNFAIYDMNKIKLLMEETHSGKKKMKICLKDQDIFIACSSSKFIENQYLDHCYFIFAKLITLKLNLMGRSYTQFKKPQPLKVEEKYLKDVRIAGKIRKSSFFSGWEQKICVINSKGLSMFKQGKQKASLSIENGGIKQLWTRLQFEGQNLIIKCLHGTSKIELSIPNENFLSRNNWLYQIYSLTLK